MSRKIDGEMKVMTGLLNNMFVHGTNDAEIERVKTYISKLHNMKKSYSELKIDQLMNKYKELERNESFDIPATVKRKAAVETKKILKEVLV